MTAQLYNLTRERFRRSVALGDLRLGQRVTLRHPSGRIAGTLVACYGDLRVTRALAIQTDDGRVLTVLRERVTCES